MVAAVMMRLATDSRVCDFSCNVGIDNVSNIAAAATYNADSLRPQDILCAFSHVSGEKSADTHFAKGYGNAALASTAFRSWERDNFRDLPFFDCDNRKVCAVAKVVVDLRVCLGRKCYLNHDSVCLI